MLTSRKTLAIPPGPLLVSACLLGYRCRLNGGHCLNRDLLDLVKNRLVIGVCPELLGGLPCPRPRAEILGGDGAAVLSGRAIVRDRMGMDVSAQFIKGARAALELAVSHGAATAVLKERSPSCGVRRIYDGTFRGRLSPGSGVTAALLARHGIKLLGEEDLQERSL